MERFLAKGAAGGGPADGPADSIVCATLAMAGEGRLADEASPLPPACSFWMLAAGPVPRRPGARGGAGAARRARGAQRREMWVLCRARSGSHLSMDFGLGRAQLRCREGAERGQGCGELGAAKGVDATSERIGKGCWRQVCGTPGEQHPA